MTDTSLPDPNTTDPVLLRRRLRRAHARERQLKAEAVRWKAAARRFLRADRPELARLRAELAATQQQLALANVRAKRKTKLEADTVAVLDELNCYRRWLVACEDQLKREMEHNDQLRLENDALRLQGMKLREQVAELLPWAVVDHSVEGYCHDGEGIHCNNDCECKEHGYPLGAPHHTHDDDLARRIEAGEFGPVA